ncbi:MAG: radical SAM protein, partial [Candidatus Acidiferrales bacterium]
MIEATYSTFSRGVHERYFGQRAPVEVSIEVTRRCPLECRHCYNNLPMSDSAARSAEMTLDEYRRLLDELAEAGCLWVLFTGGEIFARRDFLEIYSYAKSKGFLITLFTNGTMVTSRVADFLADWRPFAIEITMYGATRETYEALTRIPGSYDRCMRGIRLLRERHLPLKLKTVPTSINRHEVFEMQRM